MSIHSYGLKNFLYNLRIMEKGRAPVELESVMFDDSCPPSYERGLFDNSDLQTAVGQ